MGRGRSKGSGSSKAATKTASGPWWKTGASTPAGISYDEYMKMNDSQKARIVHDILNDSSIVVPSHLDGSDTSKFIYALGLSNKPDVVTDDQLKRMKGGSLYRTVNGDGFITGSAITDQIRNGDYTQMSGKGGSLHGRALYFAQRVGDSSVYARGGDSVMIKAKLKPGAKMATEGAIRKGASSMGVPYSRDSNDNMAIFAISNGYDGWSDGFYTMIVNRGALAISSTDKKVTRATKRW